MAVDARDNGLLATFFVLLACVPGARLLPFVLGHVAAGGIYLTPAGVEHRWGVRTTMIPWEGFAVPRADVPFHLVRLGATGADARVTETRSFPLDILGDDTDCPAGDDPPAPTPYLALGTEELVALLAFYMGRPGLRRHLGSSRSLDWEPVLPSPVTMTDPPHHPWV